MASRASPSTTRGKTRFREPSPEHLRAVIETSAKDLSPALRSSMRKKGGADHARRAAGMRASFSPDHKKQEGASRTLVVEYDDDFPGSPDSSITRSIQLTRTTGRQQCIAVIHETPMSQACCDDSCDVCLKTLPVGTQVSSCWRWACDWDECCDCYAAVKR